MPSGMGTPKGDIGRLGGSWLSDGTFSFGGLSYMAGCSGGSGGGGGRLSKSGGMGGRSEIRGGPRLLILKKVTS